MISTTMISAKLFAAWYFALKSKPGYVERENTTGVDSEGKNQLEFGELLK